MENREQQILSEIKLLMASVRSQLEQLDAKMAELQQNVDAEEDELVPIDLDIVEDAMPADVAETPSEAVEVQISDDLPFDDPDDLPPAEEPSSEPAAEQETLLRPETVETAPEVHPDGQAVIDAMTEKQAWRRDMPGSPVRDIRSAISLNDRILFINTLFGEDPMAFQDSLSRINNMASLEEAVDYVVSEHPEWNLESDVVYRFMMAVRRRLR